MTPLERSGFLAHARTPAFARRVEQALAAIREALALGPGYGACSWGKDSVCLTHLAQRVRPDIPVVFFADPEEEMLDNYAEVAGRYLSAHPTNYHRLEVAGDRVPEKVDLARLWERWPVALVGVRAEEASGRRVQLRAGGLIAPFRAGARAGSFRAWPLGHWSWRDVWAYTCLHDLPYLASYDHADAEDRSRSRTCNLVAKKLDYGPKGAEFGRIARLRQRNPAYFNHLKELYPEVARWGA